MRDSACLRLASACCSDATAACKRSCASRSSSFARSCPSFTKAPASTGVSITRPAAGGATSDDSSARKLPVTWTEEETCRVTARTVATLRSLAGPVAASVMEMFLLALLHPAAANSTIPARLTTTVCNVVRLAMQLLPLPFRHAASGSLVFQPAHHQVHKLVD